MIVTIYNKENKLVGAYTTWCCHCIYYFIYL